jgi:uncharacterized membrane protein YfcA
MELILLALLTFFASAIGTITSFGTATIMVPVLVNFYSYNPVLLFTGIIHWFGNLWKMLFFRKGLRQKLILLFGAPGVVASYIGASLILNIDKEVLSRILGVFLIVYVAFVTLNEKWKLPENNSTAIAGGIASGLFSGIFGVGGAVRATFLSAFKLQKDTFIFTAGAIGLFIDSSRIITYLANKTSIEGIFLYGMLLFLPISLLGAYVGKRVVNKIPQDKFRIVVGAGLILISIKLIALP